MDGRDGKIASAVGVVVAGGSGNRFRSERNKAYLPLAGRCLVSWALHALGAVPDIRTLVLVIRSQDRDEAQWVLEREVEDLPVELVVGGATRHESERNALRHLAAPITAGKVDTVLIHDAARPLAGPALISNVLAGARQYGGAVPALPADDIIRVDADGERRVPEPGAADTDRAPEASSVADGGVASASGGVAMVEDTRRYVRAQTPQAFRAEPLLRAFEAAALEEGYSGTDTASCAARFSGLELHWVLGDARNIKITYPQDVFLAERLLSIADYRVT